MAEFPRFTRPVSYLGLPALVLPGGFSSANLPIGFQLVAPPFAESLLLKLGHHFQRETDWHLRRPSIG
jgi:aspartyl-tRNA(Asn)/glutamyl-tRNA(Gln) amidotransferase subunit A